MEVLKRSGVTNCGFGIANCKWRNGIVGEALFSESEYTNASLSSIKFKFDPPAPPLGPPAIAEIGGGENVVLASDPDGGYQ